MQTYDAVVVGAGPNGLVIANYLAMNGMEVAVFEKAWELGGGACTSESTAPGFLGNPCASMGGHHLSPFLADFDLARRGCRVVLPETTMATVFDDNTAIVTYNVGEFDNETWEFNITRLDNVEKTINSMARFSSRDAEAYRQIYEAMSRKWFLAWMQDSFNPPPPLGEKTAIEELFEDPEYPINPAWQYMRICDILDDVFESPEIKVHCARTIMTTSGMYPVDVMGLSEFLLCGFICNILGTVYSVPVGGFHGLPHALQRCLSEYGGEYFVNSEVDRIIIENGKAVGIKLKDGTQIGARRLVISAIDVRHTIVDLVGEENVSPAIIRKVRNIKADRANIIWGQVAYHELPQYKAFEFEPALAQFKTIQMAPKDWEYMKEEAYHERIHWRPDKWPTKTLLLDDRYDIFDPSYAPPGKHVSLLEEYSHAASYLSEREWIEIKSNVPRWVSIWQQYAPNMTMDNIIAMNLFTPFDHERRNINNLEGCWSQISEYAFQTGRYRPIPELSGYKGPWQNLYFANFCWHGGHYCAGNHGYNCYKVIAKDLGLRKIWDEKGRMV